MWRVASKRDELLCAKAIGVTILPVLDLLVRAVSKVVVPLFFLGMAGSVIVIAVSFVEDLRELFGDED